MRSLLAIFAALALCASCSEPAEAGCRNGVCSRPVLGLFHRAPRVERHATVEQHTEVTTTTHTETHTVHRGCRAGRWFPGRGILRGTRAVVRGTARVASAPLRMGRHRGCH